MAARHNFFPTIRIVRATMAEYEANVDQFLEKGARLCSESPKRSRRARALVQAPAILGRQRAATRLF
jgi:hypothetical protein